MTRIAPLAESFAIEASDPSGQKKVKVAGISPQATVAELVAALVPKMGLPEADAAGRAMSYHVQLEREGRHLHATEIVGDVLRPKDSVVLQPSIMAG